MNNKYRSIMLLHALGDTIGFKNGDWEFNYFQFDKLLILDYANELIYEFIDLGGVNGIDLKDWNVSDDTMLHIAVANAMLKYKGIVNEDFIYYLKDNLILETKKILADYSGESENLINRYIGQTTVNSITSFTRKEDARNAPYNDNGGGNGAAMRSLVIGMCLYGENNRNQLIETSIVSSQLTHNNPIGYLAGFTAALFTALALENVDINDWPYILLEYLESQKIKSYLSMDNLDKIYDHGTYVRQWKKYIDTKFDKNKKPIKIRANYNPLHRIRYYYDNFFKGTVSQQIGESGYLCMIMAYDALLDCTGNWEKLIVYAILHTGDSDTIGAIAGGLYGAVYGMGDVPENMLKHLERKKDLLDVANKLYKKFNK